MAKTEKGHGNGVFE